jgi:GTP-dependent phosphoenolpyruvate carboxykinase
MPVTLTHTLTMIILGLLFASSATAKDYSNITVENWKVMRQFEKVYYVKGFSEGFKVAHWIFKKDVVPKNDDILSIGVITEMVNTDIYNNEHKKDDLVEIILLQILNRHMDLIDISNVMKKE